MSYTWLAVVVAAIVIEAITVGLVSIWFVPGALAAMIMAFLSVPVYLQLTVFFGLSILFLVLSRTIWKKYLVHGSPEPTNAELLIGATGIVTTDIDNIRAVGEVKVNGQFWSARSADPKCLIAKDSYVKIISIEGIKLICEKLD